MNYIVDDIGKIVTAMRSDPVVKDLFGPSLQGLIPFYLYGHRLDVSNRLLQKNLDAVYKEQKYPLVALFMDFPEVVANGMASYDLHIAILHITDANYTIEDRYIKVFKPILYPLYLSFMDKLRKVGKFTWPADQSYPPHTKTDRPYWGTVYEEGSERYIFNDRLDAIEISDLKVNKTIKNCD
jgi:hypothetical protein